MKWMSNLGSLWWENKFCSGIFDLGTQSCMADSGKAEIASFWFLKAEKGHMGERGQVWFPCHGRERSRVESLEGKLSFIYNVPPSLKSN